MSSFPVTWYLWQAVLGVLQQGEHMPVQDIRGHADALVTCYCWHQGQPFSGLSWSNVQKNWSKGSGDHSCEHLCHLGRMRSVSLWGTHHKINTPPHLNCDFFFPLSSPGYLLASRENRLRNSRQYVRLQRKMYWCLTGSQPTLCW